MKKILLLLLLLLSAPLFAVQPSQLFWDYPDVDIALYGVTVFNIERKAEACDGTGAFVEIAAVPSSERAYTDTAVTPGVTYCYRAFATGAAGKSGPSNMAAKTVPFDLPAAPGNLRVD